LLKGQDLQALPRGKSQHSSYRLDSAIAYGFNRDSALAVL